jgi:hypothetical protein
MYEDVDEEGDPLDILTSNQEEKEGLWWCVHKLKRLKLKRRKRIMKSIIGRLL